MKIVTFKSKDSEKFLGVLDNKICLTENEYQWKQLNSSEEGYFYIVSLEDSRLCITPLSIEDRKGLELKKIDPTNQSQLWKKEGDYLINKLEQRKGKIKKMCIDVCCEKKDNGTPIIIYHKKSSNAKNLKNQQWDIN